MCLPRILVVDDEAPARARLLALLGDIEAEFPHTLAGEAADGREALAFLSQQGADIVLVDVQMPLMDGLELARHAGLLQVPPAVVFVTAFDAFALEAFEVHALDYLVKPVRAQKLQETLKRVLRLTTPQTDSISAAARQTRPAGRQFLSVHERGRMILISVADILYLKAELKYVTIRTVERQYLTEESLVALEEEFAAGFVRVHRNALVARGAIVGSERVENINDDELGSEPHWEVVLRGITERLPVSRRQWPVVKGLLRR